MRFKKTLTLILSVVLLSSCVLAGFAADAVPEYIIGGGPTSDGEYELTVSVNKIYAYTGRIGLTFDTDKLELIGEDSLAAFHMASGVNSVAEVRPESSMVSGDGGFACLAWYSEGTDALSGAKQIASLRFRLKNELTAQAIDESAFGLYPVQSGDFGPWVASASLRGRGNRAPINYEYMTDDLPLGIVYSYEGSDRAAQGHTVKFVCRNPLGAPVNAKLELGGRVYSTDENGEITVTLRGGEYLWRASADGYGANKDRLSVTGDSTVNVAFVNDETLVAQALAGLEIGYGEGDSEKRVTGALVLPYHTESGVDITWKSDHSGIITSEGLVYLPEKTRTDVTLTATLKRGVSTAEKTFKVTVYSVDDLRQGGYLKPGQSGTQQPGEDDPVPGTDRFTDMGNHSWAKEAVEMLAKAGIIGGRTATTFAPADNVTRGEFITMLMRMIDPSGIPECTFKDVAKDTYYYTPIAQAQVLGIATGVGNGKFEPNKTITRQDMIVLTIRAMQKTGYYNLTEERTAITAYGDGGLISDYALDSVRLAVGQGLINGDGGSLKPLAPTTRAETAAFLARIYTAHNAK